MKYRLLRLSLLSVLVMLCGGMLHAQSPEVTLDFTSQAAWNIPTSGTNKDLATFTNGTYSIKLYATNNYKMNSGYLILGKADSYLELPAFDFDVEKIEVVGTSGASAAVKQNIFVGENAVSTETTGAQNVTNTYEIASAYQAAGNIYKLKVTSAHNTQIAQVLIYKKASTTDNRVATSITLVNPTTTAAVGDVVALPSAELKAADESNITDAVINWESSDETVAKFEDDATIGMKVLKALKVGTATITAKYAGNDTYKASSASFTLTVKEYTQYTSIASMLENITSTKTDIKYTFSDLTVTYANDKYAYIYKSGDGAMMLYGDNLGLEAGCVYNGSLVGQLYTYYGLPEIAVSANDINVEKQEGMVAVGIPIITIAELPYYINKQCAIQNAEYVSANSKNLTFKVGETEFTARNNFNLSTDALVAGKKYTVEGFGAVYNDTYQIYPTNFMAEQEAVTFQDFEITNEQLSGAFDASTLPACATFSGTQRNDSHGYGNVTITVVVDKPVKFTIGGCQYANPANCKVTNAAGEVLATPNLKTATCYHQDGAAATYTYDGEPTTLTFSDIAYLPYFKAEAIEDTPEPHDPVLLVWDYTNKDIPTTGPDNGLYYGAYVNDPAGTNNGMHGVKLNSSGWAYFEKPAVAGKLTLTFGNRKTADAYAVNVSTGTLGADNVGVKGDLIGEVAVAESPGTGSIDIPAEVTGIYINRKTGSEGVLSKIVFKEDVPRQFVDFEITNEQLSGAFDASTLPAGVTFNGTQRNDSHGYGNVTITVPVDGTVKFTIGGCQYANPANCKVTNAAGEVLATPNLRTATCYHQDGAAATYIYVGEPTTLTFSEIAYLPYFKAEATDVHEVTVTYKDQNGGVLGKKTVYEGDPIGEIPYTEADLTIPAGEKFRGWVYNSKIKVKATDIVNADVTVNASVTPIEEAPTVGSIQTYDLTQATFYPEDHENFSVEGGTYYNNHGFTFADGGSFTVAVTSKAQIVLNLCQYGNGTTITVVDSQGRVVTDNLPAKAEADGGTAVLNYEGPAGQLQFTFATQAYLHKVTVYNVSDFLAKDESGYYIVPANDGASLIMAINAVAADPNAKIFLPNGTYDLGEATLTGISGTNVSIIGQSMENVIIKNTPATENEGLGKAELFINTSKDLYMQDLTLQNALDYYKAGSAGRAAVLQDGGTRTIGKNVRMLSYQDTYYSSNNSQQAYWENSDIHGTVDFICGGGDVRFQNTTISLEPRAKDGSGSRTITAPTTNTNFGYVFDGCTIVDLANGQGSWNYGRTWQNAPICVYLNTTLDDNAKNTIVTKRWIEKGMNNTDPKVFGEYSTKDATGADITPASNIITSYGGEFETILTADQAAAYSYDKMFAGDWKPAQLAKQLEAPAAEFANGTVTWTPANDGAIAYMIEKNGEFVGITAGSSMAVEANAESDKLTIRAANARGGFGEAKQVAYTGTSIQAINAAIERGEQVIFNLAGQRVNKATKGMYIINGKKMVVK